jgi:hypothetical protein
MKVLREGGGGGEEGQSSGQNPHLSGWLGGLGRRQVLQVQLFNSQVLQVQLLHITYLYRVYYWVSTNAKSFVEIETSNKIAKNPL